MSTDAATKTARSYRGISMEKRREIRHSKLIEAGKQVFGDQGFSGATVRQVCQAAGLTERYFYESFENLHQLFSEVYDQELDRLRGQLISAISQAPGGVEEMARAGLTENYSFFKNDPRAARILLIEIYGTTQDMRRLYRRGVQDFADLVRGIIETQFDLPANSRLDAGLLATALVGATTQLGVRWFLSEYEHSVEVMVENSLAIILAVSEKLQA